MLLARCGTRPLQDFCIYILSIIGKVFGCSVMARTFDGNNTGQEGARGERHDERRRDSDGNTYSTEEIAEEAEEGRHLYLEFVREEIERSGLSEPTLTLPDDEDDGQNRGSIVNRLWLWNLDRHDFRQLTNEFSRSAQRELIRRQAQAVMLESLDMQHFYNFCEGLFSGGVDRERIAILFFFCSDLAIEALKKGLRRTFYSLLEWSLSFIATRVAIWVHKHGGWGAVLRTSLTIAYQVTACCAFVTVAVACIMYIRRQFN
ncbi:unnamed protein product [Allacma fusca]|uniref:Bcl-2 Bcl-2 homology region 1-3 domain-containing protein n=1 Tax=Allacma fusca TaxID=39272 RepID=A0A8J2JQP9_9HEXA|nr:unnamed protein product [Allacma fusca]